jgi:hypothetical protein
MLHGGWNVVGFALSEYSSKAVKSYTTARHHYGKAILCWTCEVHFVRRQKEKESSMQLLMHVDRIRGKRFYEKYFFKNLPLIGGIGRIPC